MTIQCAKMSNIYWANAFEQILQIKYVPPLYVYMCVCVFIWNGLLSMKSHNQTMAPGAVN